MNPSSSTPGISSDRHAECSPISLFWRSSRTEIRRRSSSAQPFGLFDPVVETKQHDEAKRDTRHAAGQEQPLPAGKAVQPVQIVRG